MDSCRRRRRRPGFPPSAAARPGLLAACSATTAGLSLAAGCSRVDGRAFACRRLLRVDGRAFACRRLLRVDGRAFACRRLLRVDGRAFACRRLLRDDGRVSLAVGCSATTRGGLLDSPAGSPGPMPGFGGSAPSAVPGSTSVALAVVEVDVLSDASTGVANMPRTTMAAAHAIAAVAACRALVATLACRPPPSVFPHACTQRGQPSPLRPRGSDLIATSARRMLLAPTTTNPPS